MPGRADAQPATGGNGTVALGWTPPASNGGSAITGYKVYRGTASGGETLLTTLGLVTSYVDSTGVPNGTTYYYRVSAVNAVGEGALSNERSATPGDRARRARRSTRPTAGNGTVALAWTRSGLERRRRDHRLQGLPRHHERRRDAR